MPFSALLLFSVAMLNVKPSPVFADVSIGTRGPYRFLVDTGDTTSFIDSRLAAELNLKPEYRVEVVTPNSTRLLPAFRSKSLHVGPNSLPDSELVFDDLVEAKRLDSSTRGVLGMNALAGYAFTLRPRANRLDLQAPRPDGDVVPLHRLEDRIAVEARMGRETLMLILDSGANNVVLFHTPQAMAKTEPVATTLATLDGARHLVPTCWTADMFFTSRLRVGTLPAAIAAPRDTHVDGLLPASVFKAVYIDQARGEVVLVR